jgi:hypothetical protein
MEAEMEEEKKRHRLAFEVNEKVLITIKKHALERQLTLRKWVMRAIDDRIKKDIYEWEG